jgi:hypothetical protein
MRVVIRIFVLLSTLAAVSACVVEDGDYYHDGWHHEYYR